MNILFPVCIQNFKFQPQNLVYTSRDKPKRNVRVIFDLEVAGMLLKAYRLEIAIIDLSINYKLNSDDVYTFTT